MKNKKKVGKRFSKMLTIVLLVLVILLLANNPVREYLLSLVYQEKITPEDLKTSYNERRFKILLVPGHDNQYGGAQYLGVKEADINLLVAEELSKLLSADNHFVISVTRDFDSGEYTEIFGNFFQSQRERILAFRNEKRNIFERFIKSGELKTNIIVGHNFAPSEVALRLQGVNLWSNENEVDLTLHLHANDMAGRRPNQPGLYNGFSIYVPERQFPNSRASTQLAQSLLVSLKQSMTVSNLPGESVGVIEDQELIAIGSYATRDGAAALIEYGYIYEPRFNSPSNRQQAAKEIARRTYEGLIDYLEPDKVSFAD
jgi:N-acetylmuramoyl-L-alanine amidase